MSTASNELEEFRRQWRQEVESRKHHHRHQQQKQPTPVESPPTTTTTTTDNLSIKKPTSPPLINGHNSATTLQQQMSSLSIEENEEQQVEEPVKEEPKAVSAMDHYIFAVNSERQGRLGEALASYRRAFKMDPDIDYAYKRHYQTHIAPTFSNDQQQQQQQQQQQPTSPTNQFQNRKDDDFLHLVPIGREWQAPSADRKDPLEELIDEITASQPIEYIPFVDYKPVHVANVPAEIMLHVLRHLILRSVSSVANFALVCKNFFLMTRSPSLWRYACEHAFKSPYMTVDNARKFQADYVKIYGGHWMRMFIERPRLRYDGIYISTCNYVRPGSNENTYNQPVHLVTYYRYLRFFPDGTIIKYLSTDEPAQVVRLLTPEFSRKQVFRGHFEQSDGTVYIEMKDWLRPREDFRMTLEIKSTHRGRHNKLVWLDYSSFPDGREEDESSYDLKMMKPYFFSPVRSYHVDPPSTPLHDLVGPLTRRRGTGRVLKN